MARGINKLSALGVQRATKIGLYGDGGNLFLRVGHGAAKSWVFRYFRNGKPHEAGLGSAITFSLKEARERARAFRQQLADGIDPIAARQKKRAERRLEMARAMTFRQAAEALIKAKATEWTNPRHAAQWPQTLTTYVYPILGSLPVQAIDTGLVLKTIELLWREKPETASRVRGRIESVLDWATARGYRQGDNPARWKGHLENLLAKTASTKAAVRRETGRGEHHRALPYAELPEFMSRLRTQSGVVVRCLEFVILTAARSGEALGASWSEINLDERLWVVPGSRMKAGKEWRVPLSDRAIEIITAMAAIRESDFVFPGGRARRPLSHNAMMMALQRMGGDMTVHGFRSSFSTWVSERTAFPSEVREMALAHSVGTAVEQAYMRSDLFGKRRALAAAWARFCSMPVQGGAVVPMRRSATS
jgi:integrase